MTRIIDFNGTVHFRGTRNSTLCALPDSEPNLIGERTPIMHEVPDPVTCPDCAKLYCQIKNSPWNEVEDATMDKAIYDAVKPDGSTEKAEK